MGLDGLGPHQASRLGARPHERHRVFLKCSKTWGVSENLRCLIWGPYNEDPSI